MYLLAFEQIIAKLFAQLNGNISEGTFATTELLKVVANTIPLFVAFACLLSEVGEKIDLLLVLVEEMVNSKVVHFILSIKQLKMDFMSLIFII